jgi:hypothetical protein
MTMLATKPTRQPSRRAASKRKEMAVLKEIAGVFIAMGEEGRMVPRVLLTRPGVRKVLLAGLDRAERRGHGRR